MAGKLYIASNLSDDNAPAKTGITILNFPYPLAVQEEDIFAHWQAGANGAIPLNTDELSFDGLSVGQYGFRSEEIEIGQEIENEGFNGAPGLFCKLHFYGSAMRMVLSILLARADTSL